MNGHEWYEDLLPQYAAGSLDEGLHRQVSQHVETCQECQADLQFWTALSDEIKAQNRSLSAPPLLTEKVLRRIEIGQRHLAGSLRTRLGEVLQREIDLLRIQAPLVRRELWPASAIVILIGLAVAYMIGNSMVIRVLAPLVAAAGLAAIYGVENDPVIELILSCPTSPRQILLARGALVFGYNLVLALLASLALKSLVPPDVFGSLIMSWLGPMAFLSATALLLSIWMGTSNVITLTYVVWLAQFVPDLQLQAVVGWMQWLTPLAQAYRQLWANPLLLLASACGLLLLALWSAGRSDQKLPHWT